MLYEEYRFDDLRLPGLSPVCCGTEQCEPGFSVGATRPDRKSVGRERV